VDRGIYNRLVVGAPAGLQFTYADYLLLPEESRYELLDGDLFLTPAPTTGHQRVSRNLSFLLHDFVQNRRLGEVLPAPCDVVLSETNVVQPDILFVSAERLSIIGEKNVAGPPDLVVEVLSAGTEERDRTLKTKLYARFGVRELWVADPKAKTVALFVLSGEGYRQEAVFGVGEILRSPLLPGLEISLDDVF
jgi:Uma2 family endonuclease